MLDLPEITSLPILVVGVFIVTLGTIMLPGPTLVAASRFGVARGARSVLAFLATVVAVDVLVFGLLAFGFQPLLERLGAARWLIPVGGAALLLFGVVMVLSSRREGGPGTARVSHFDNPLLAGIVVPVASPGFWLWWTTVGATFIHLAAAWGHLGVLAAFVAYFTAVSGWYLVFSAALARGRQLLAAATVHGIQVALGVLMAGLGLVVLLRQLGSWIS